MNKVYILAILALFALIPTPAHAVRVGNILDPLCLFSWRDGCKDEINIDNSIDGSFNVNSNVNSPGGVVTDNVGTVNYNTNTSTGNNGGNNNYDSDLYVSCNPDDSYVETDERVRWSAYASGGTGSYQYSWSGSEGLSGSGSSASIEYDNDGTKTASVRISSGSKSVTRSCGSVHVEDDRDNYYNDDDYDYYDSYSYDRPSVYCYPDITYTTTNERVIWRAYASGGNGRYSYTWTGTDGLRGSSEGISRQYDRSGTKSASVTVRSNGRSTSASCGSVSITGGSYQNYAPAPVYQTGLAASCSPSLTYAKVGAVVTWTVYPTGGNGVYSYIWSGSDGFSGSQKSVVTSYRSTGPKYATVSVYSAGKTTTISCGTTNISSATTVKKPIVKKPIIKPDAPIVKVTPDTTDFNVYGEVPWMFVMIIVIAVLFVTVMYLLISKKG